MQLLHRHFLVLIFLLVFVGCSWEHKYPVAPEKPIPPVVTQPPVKMDSLLIGDWLRIDDLRNKSGRMYHVSGMRVLPDGYVYSLGINPAKGELALLMTEYKTPARLGRFKVADSGRYTFNGSLQFGYTTEGDYVFHNDTLRIRIFFRNENETYVRAHLSDKLTDSYYIHFPLFETHRTREVQIGAMELPAFAIFSGGSLNLMKVNYDPWDKRTICSVSIQDASVGTHQIRNDYINWAYVWYDELCYQWYWETVLDNAGSITIDTLDLTKKRCSGSFHFIAGEDSARNVRASFSVPLFSE